MSIGSWPGRPEPPYRPDPLRPGWPLPPEPPTPEVEPVPRRSHAVMVPIVDFPRAAREVRRVVASGPLDTATTTRIAAELMAFDGESADDIEVVINSDGGPLADVLALLDVIGAMRATVTTRCLGRAIGSAAVLLAAGTGGRSAGPHAVISLRDREIARIEGSPVALRAQLDDLEHARERVLDALVRSTGQPRDELRRQLDAGPLLDPAAAAALGLIDPAG
jgi:ATP-dependent Clp protease, protease subunit